MRLPLGRGSRWPWQTRKLGWSTSQGPWWLSSRRRRWLGAANRCSHSRPLGSDICSVGSFGGYPVPDLELDDAAPSMRSVYNLLPAKTATIDSIEEWKVSEKEIFAMVKLVFQSGMSLGARSDIWQGMLRHIDTKASHRPTKLENLRHPPAPRRTFPESPSPLRVLRSVQVGEVIFSSDF